METLTTNEALALGALAGSIIVFVFMIIFIAWLIAIIAMWKIFKKAGEPGWKVLIPVYNTYTLYKIIGLSFWKWLFFPGLFIGFLSAASGYFVGVSDEYIFMSSILSSIGFVIEIVILVKFASAFAKAYGKSKPFAVGLFFFPTLFQLILGYGSAKYVKNKKSGR